MKSFPKSAELLRSGSDTDAMMRGRPSLFFGAGLPVHGAPLFVDRGSGPYIWDVDGNRFLDCVLGWGSVILGHAERCTDDAAIAAIRKGINPTLASPMQPLLSGLLAKEIPNAESSAFFKTGSDATDIAVRLARAVTGRRAVAHWGLHGWHDWSSGGSAGVLDGASQFTHLLHFNDIDRSLEVLRSICDDLACVIVMPYEVEMPADNFLQELRRAAHGYGALFVLDEIRSGFRIHRSGAQVALNIDADLVALGKAMGNGYPISALCGRRHLMDEIIKLGITVTFFRSPASMAASFATISRLIEIDGAGRLAVLGARLMKNISDGCSEYSEVFCMRGHQATPEPEFIGALKGSARRCRELLCWRLFRRGLLTPASHHWFLCTSMSEADIDFASEVVIDSVGRVVADSLDS